MPNPLVSIVISVYRRAEFLALAIQSALAQEYAPLEVIVVEDGGSSVASTVIDSFRDSGVRLIRQGEQVGAAANKLAGWQAAAGELLVNLDDDDLLEPAFLRQLVPPLVNFPEASISFCDHFILRADGTRDLAATEENTRKWRRDRLSTGLLPDPVEAALILQSVPLAMGAVFRKQLVNDFDVLAGPSYDLFLTYLGCRNGAQLHYVSDRLSGWRVHSGQETSVGRLRTAAGSMFCYDSFLNDPALARWRVPFSRKLGESKLAFGTGLLKCGRCVEAREHLRHAVRLKAGLRARVARAVSMLPPRLAQLVATKLAGT